MDALLKFITRELKPYVTDLLKARSLFSFWEIEGMHIMPVHFYSPIPDTSKLPPSVWQKSSEMAGVDMNDEGQLSFIRDVLPLYRHEYEQFPLQSRGNRFEFSYDNTQFVGLDPVVLHSFVRHFRPARIIEVGSGYSTLVTAQALRLNGGGDLTCIEPFPRDFIREGVPGVSRLHQCSVQEIDLELFQQLGENDILFIDSTHVAKIGSDVLYLFFEVLPRLRPGVIVHIHDIFFPGEYPEKWIRENNFFWNEQYLLQAFLIGNTQFRVEYCVGYMGKRHLPELQKLFPNYSCGMGGGSFWMRRI